FFFFFSSRRRHTRFSRDWSSDVCSSDLPGLHYYVINIDGADVSDPGSQAFFGGTRYTSAIEIPAADGEYYAIQDVPHGQVREVRSEERRVGKEWGDGWSAHH